MSIKTWIIEIEGLIQGVGFRPFVYNLAHKMGLKGYVFNQNDCVMLSVQGNEDDVDLLIEEIQEKLPAPAKIDAISIKEVDEKRFEDFAIIKSRDISYDVTEISPDIAICPDCLNDLKEQPHRINYPFINCTHCGPRFTIIQNLPYDRERTTMSVFKMCDKCFNEYEDITDRRFHAQPVACNFCGPTYSLHFKDEETTDLDQILLLVRQIISDGGIIALKGMGGFHFACDAFNEQAVQRLRQKKYREGKPFAVLFRDLYSAKKHVFINKTEEEALVSWQRPIVLLKEKQKFPMGISNGLDTVGVMLPYMPIHYLLFSKWDVTAIVFTSGNLSDEPIVIENNEAQKRFSSIADAILSYNRNIYNRVDDSVAMEVNSNIRLIRRSRGYAPSSIKTKLNLEGVFAAGAELVNCFCIGRKNKAYLSQHIGDLQNLETYEFYQEAFKRYSRLFRFKPELVAHDLHPDYLSTRFAQSFDLYKVAIQHHHAHIASCMVENGVDEKVIGVSFDGTGLGDDGNIWGGEFFVCDLLDYERKFHFDYAPMPGGDKAAKESWRMALSYLYHVFGDDVLELELDFLKNIDNENKNLVLQSIKQKINAPFTSSAGRLFDAVSALLNICTKATYHAEAPMKLESAIQAGVDEKYDYEVVNHTISFKRAWEEMLNDVLNKIDKGIVAAKFHNTIISVIFNTAKHLRVETGINKIALSGGVFQNKYLSENVENKLKNEGFDVFVQKQVPANDGGIALGQIAVAAKRRMMGLK